MPRKQKKGKSKDTAPKVPSSVTQKPPNTKLMLRVPPFSGAKAQAVPEIVPEAASGSLQPDEDIHIDSDTYMPEIPYVPSPRQQLIDHYWENITDTQESNQKDDLPNEAASHPENPKDLGVPLAGAGATSSRKRKASDSESTHSRLEHGSSVNFGSHGNDTGSHSDTGSSDEIIQPAVTKKARKTPREPIEVEESDEELDKVVTKGQQARKPSKKERALRNTSRESDDEEESYKNST